MKIKRAIERFPGGMMVIPLLWGSVLNTFAPHVLAIGSFSTQLAHGALPILAVFFVCMGAEIQLRTAPRALRNGAAITLAKLASGVAIGFAVSRLCGSQGLFGLSGMAIIAAVTNANMGLYAAVTRQFGDEVDRGALAVLSILEGPFVTMVALGLSGLATIPVIDLVATVLPIVIGMVLGNLDEDMRRFLKSGGDLLIPFFAFGLGAQINLHAILGAGLSGILLGLITLAAGAVCNVLASRLAGGTGVAGMAAATTAGNAVATPTAIAAVDPRLGSLVAMATPQIAASTIVTSLLAPLAAAAYARWHGRRRARDAELHEAASTSKA
ncbi:2-keto-3-deoxygluconate permease [Burkholderia sp. Ap-962]|uniref:2-keto-3-deoxygluconate permease n=1 Tax=Burkholderia sp. Ap-962 TaxID=2608333 RepID=UPI001422D505|nr:2-keto-3-deoxygluconate permease [Burkholderia sp. Ap-962]NIF69242.1 2-keto-3-deoxygluconate permease [Burkholderia sp. Ap-962]